MPQNAARQGQVLPQSGPYSCVFILYIMLLCNMYHSLYGDSWARLLALQTWIWAHFHERDCVTRLLPHFLWSKLSSWALYKQVKTIFQFFYFSGYLLWKKQQVKFKNSKIARLYSCWLRRYGDSLVMDYSTCEQGIRVVVEFPDFVVDNSDIMSVLSLTLLTQCHRSCWLRHSGVVCYTDTTMTI